MGKIISIVYHCKRRLYKSIFSVTPTPPLYIYPQVTKRIREFEQVLWSSNAPVILPYLFTVHTGKRLPNSYKSTYIHTHIDYGHIHITHRTQKTSNERNSV